MDEAQIIDVSLHTHGAPGTFAVEKPIAFDISWSEGTYRVSVPRYLAEDERRTVVELEPVLGLLEAIDQDCLIDLNDPKSRAAVGRLEAFLQQFGRLR